MTDHLEVGRIHRSHGLRGELVVSLVTNRTERLAPGAELFAADDRMLEVVSSRQQGDKWIVAFDGITSREDADEMRGQVLTAPPIEDPDELWVHDLIGASVVEADGNERGVVDSVLSNPASDILVLDSGALVPLTFVVERSGTTLIIDPPEGLFDL